MAMSVLMNMQRRMPVPAVGLLVMTIVASTMSTPVHRGRLRVGRPCSGGLADNSAQPPPTTDVDVSVSRHQVRRSLRSVAGLLSTLCSQVNQLRTNYAANRDVVHIGMHVEGMPRYTEVHISTPNSQTTDVPSMVANVTSRLSRVAVFIHLLRLEETRHEPRPFDDALRSIEDHAEHGLYGILCRLHIIHRLASAVDGNDNVDLAATVDAALSEVQLIEATRPAHRHLRAISIISDFAQLLQRLIVVLDYTA